LWGRTCSRSREPAAATRCSAQRCPCVMTATLAPREPGQRLTSPRHVPLTHVQIQVHLEDLVREPVPFRLPSLMGHHATIHVGGVRGSACKRGGCTVVWCPSHPSCVRTPGARVTRRAQTAKLQTSRSSGRCAPLACGHGSTGSFHGDGAVVTLATGASTFWWWMARKREGLCGGESVACRRQGGAAVAESGGDGEGQCASVFVGELELVHGCQWGTHYTSMPKRVAIVGCGAGGLASAHLAAQSGATLTLYEKGAHLGGHASTQQVRRRRCMRGCKRSHCAGSNAGHSWWWR